MSFPLLQFQLHILASTSFGSSPAGRETPWRPRFAEIVDRIFSRSPTPSPRLAGFRFPLKDYAAKHSETWLFPPKQIRSPGPFYVSAPLPTGPVPLTADSLHLHSETSKTARIRSTPTVAMAFL